MLNSENHIINARQNTSLQLPQVNLFIDKEFTPSLGNENFFNNPKTFTPALKIFTYKFLLFTRCKKQIRK